MNIAKQAMQAAAYQLLLRPLRVTWQWNASWPERPSDWEPVRFPSAQGSLSGLWGAASACTKGTIVCAHPTLKKAKGFFLQHGYGRLREAGYNVLLFDFGGHGASAFTSLDYPGEVLAAGREAQRRAPSVPVGLLGVCFGAVNGICAMTRDDHPFEAAVMESPYPGVAEITARLCPVARRPRLMRVSHLFARCFERFWRELRPADQAAHLRNTKAVLLISASEDHLVPPETVQTLLPLLRSAPGRPSCAHRTFEGASHLEAAAQNPDRYFGHLLAFFDRHLAAGEARTPAYRPRPLEEGRLAAA